MFVGGRTALKAVVSRVQSVLMNVCLNNRVGLDVHRVPPAIRLDTEREVGVRIDIPVQSTEKPESSILVPKRGVSYCNSGMG